MDILKIRTQTHVFKILFEFSIEFWYIFKLIRQELSFSLSLVSGVLNDRLVLAVSKHVFTKLTISKYN
jgi:hypothetical protein